MLITFKSPAGGDVMMFEKNARELVGVLGKERDAPRGIITVDQLPGAMAALEIAMEADQHQPALPAAGAVDNGDEPDARVSFGQRAGPLLELLARALKEQVPVTWGV